MQLNNCVLKLPTDKLLVVDVECRSLDARFDRSVPVYVISTIEYDGSKGKLRNFRDTDKAVEFIQGKLKDGWHLVAHNAKFDYAVLKVRGLQHYIQPGSMQVLDTMVMSFAKDSTLPSYSLDALTGEKQDILSVFVSEGLLPEKTNLKELWSRDWSVNSEAIDLLTKYCALDCKATLKLYLKLARWYNANRKFIWTLLHIELPMLEVLSHLERYGVYVNQSRLDALAYDLETELQKLRATVALKYPLLPSLTWDGEEFVPKIKTYADKGYRNKSNISRYYMSTDGTTKVNWQDFIPGDNDSVVYSHCKLVEYNSASGTGHNWWILKRECPEILERAVSSYKTNRPKLDKEFFSSVLDVLPDGIPIAKIIKLTTYLSKCNEFYGSIKSDGRVHCNFQHTATRTTRLATSNPNIQNISRPFDDKHPDYGTSQDWGRRMRQLFTAPMETKKLLVADLDSIEVCVLAWYLACVEKDFSLLHIIESGESVHTSNSKRWKLERTLCKTVLFLLIYGGTSMALYRKGLMPSEEKAKQVFDQVNLEQPAIQKLKTKVWNKVRLTGYVCNVFKSRGLYPELTSNNKRVRSEGERKSFNYLIQKTARDILNLLLIESLPVILRHDGIMVNVVHDECIVECPSENADHLVSALNSVWNKRTDILPTPAIPINGDWNTGYDWYEAK
jgi:DNA polymerase I-like protein with 3'-5' exonuclease and polymerase domains